MSTIACGAIFLTSIEVGPSDMSDAIETLAGILIFELSPSEFSLPNDPDRWGNYLIYTIVNPYD